MVPRQVGPCLAVYRAFAPFKIRHLHVWILSKRHEASIAWGVPLSPGSHAIYASAVTTRPIAWARGLLVAMCHIQSSINYTYRTYYVTIGSSVTLARLVGCEFKLYEIC